MISQSRCTTLLAVHQAHQVLSLVMESDCMLDALQEARAGQPELRGAGVRPVLRGAVVRQVTQSWTRNSKRVSPTMQS